MRLEPLDFPLEACTKLESFNLSTRIKDPKTWTRLETLLTLNPELECLTVMIDGVDRRMNKFMETLVSSCPKLQSLVVPFNRLDDECTNLMLDVSVRVKELDMLDVQLVPPSTMDRWPVFPNLQKLDMSLSYGLSLELQLEVIRRSPQLRSLSWCLYDMNESMSALPGAIATYCPHLDTLRLTEVNPESLDISQVLTSCRRLSEVTIMCAVFDAAAQLSLSRHFPHLTHLDIGISVSGTTSAMVLQVLTSCPQLCYIHAERLDVRDILGVVETEGADGNQTLTYHPPYWACTNLRSLQVYIHGLKDKPEEWQRMVLWQISKMKKLNVLRVGRASCEHVHDGLDLRLNGGIDVLSGLDIRILGFGGLWQKMEEQDVRWMVKTWPRLSFMDGRLHHDFQRHQELQAILKD
ncbi:hypothetical protein BGX31_010674, partial [Mortierella sp. GBA43]